jgi:hypothetical protein
MSSNGVTSTVAVVGSKEIVRGYHEVRPGDATEVEL